MGKINSLLFLCFVIGSTAQAFEIAGTGSARVEFENTDIFVSYGESTLSNEDARDVVDRKADSHCSSLGHHYYADRASAYKDGSFITYRCNPIYRPGCRDTYKFTSEAKFKCETAGW